MLKIIALIKIQEKGQLPYTGPILKLTEKFLKSEYGTQHQNT